MNYEKIKEILEVNKSIKFKLYSLEYIIELIDNIYVIYAINYPTRKNSYNSLDELMNNYTVYNESLTTQFNRIKVIE